MSAVMDKIKIHAYVYGPLDSDDVMRLSEGSFTPDELKTYTIARADVMDAIEEIASEDRKIPLNSIWIGMLPEVLMTKSPQPYAISPTDITQPGVDCEKIEVYFPPSFFYPNGLTVGLASANSTYHDIFTAEERLNDLIERSGPNSRQMANIFDEHFAQALRNFCLNPINMQCSGVDEKLLAQISKYLDENTMVGEVQAVEQLQTSLYQSGAMHHGDTEDIILSAIADAKQECIENGYGGLRLLAGLNSYTKTVLNCQLSRSSDIIIVEPLDIDTLDGLLKSGFWTIEGNLLGYCMAMEEAGESVDDLVDEMVSAGIMSPRAGDALKTLDEDVLRDAIESETDPYGKDDKDGNDEPE